jgi:hypothetical protein
MGESFVPPGLWIRPRELPRNGQNGKLAACALCIWLDKVAMQWSDSERLLPECPGTLMTRGGPCWLILGAILLSAGPEGDPRRMG